MKSERANRIEAGIWSVVFVMMFAGPLVHPIGDAMLAGFFFLVPVPLIILNVRVSPIYATGLALAASLLYWVILGFPEMLLFLMLVGFWSQFVGVMIRRRSRYSRILFWGTVMALGSLILVRVMVIALKLPAQADALGQMIHASAGAFSDGGYDSAELSGDAEKLIPFFVVYLMALYAAANFFLSKWILGRQGIQYEKIPQLKDFQLPEHFLQGALFIAALAWGSELAGLVQGHILMETVLYLMTVVMAFQGLGLAAFLMEQWEIPVFWSFGLLIALIFIIGLAGLAISGCLDLIFDFRRQRHRTGGE